MSEYEILEPGDTFEGRSYSELIQEWANWLVSSSPDYQSSESILFLRGDLDYSMGQNGSRYMESKGTLKLEQTIYKKTLVFFPVMTAMYTLNEMYEGKQLLDEASLRYAVRKDTSMSPKVWLRYKTSKKTTWGKVLQNKKMEEFYVQSPKFILSVKSDNPFREKFEYPLAADNYEAVVGGFFVAVKLLESDRIYRFHFGGIGRGSYRTDVFYDISVLDEAVRLFTKDVSAENNTSTDPKVWEKDPMVKKFLHLKNEAEIENSSPL